MKRQKEAFVKLQKPLMLFLGLVTSLHIQAAMNCSLPANIAGEQYCPANGNYQTCRIDITNFAGVPEPRYFCLSEPTNPMVTNASAILMFHGGGQIGSKVAKHWSNQRSGSFIILPNAKVIGTKRKWNIVKQTIPNFDDLKSTTGHSDTEFVERILQELDAQYSCDNGGTSSCIENYFATGFSSGAGMTFQLYTRNEFNDWFDGYGPVSNHLNKEQTVQYNAGAGTGNATIPLYPRPIMLVMGTEETTNLPLAGIIEVVEATPACNMQPDFIEPLLHCYSEQVGQLSRSNRYKTSKWLRDSNNTIPLGVMSSYDLPTDDTMIASRFYAKNPANVNAKAVSIWTVINGAHYWPSINYQIADRKHSEDIETSDELVKFWIDEAGFIANQNIIFISYFE